MEGRDLQILLQMIPHHGMKTQVLSANHITGKINYYDKPLIVISNTEPSWLPGKHWTCFYIPTSGTPEFFDSFGHSPEHYAVNFQTFLFQNSTMKQFYYNSRQLQRVGSNICGLYCILYVIGKIKGQSFPSFVKQFEENKFQSNDKLCLLKIENFFNVKFQIED